ncbi:nuclear distribution protein nudE-like 1-B isoform X2 [Rhodnius prolixus]|uniref:nuclear distribution protein nudE-like 1-B isoform X2 n=1 Tax=Rhodnius prolixus TaxID=13249 RepID=UPI003D18A9B0
MIPKNFTYSKMKVCFYKEMNNIKQDVSFWRNRAEEIEKEFEDFRENSQMLEREMEISLEQADKTIKELSLKCNTLQLENDRIKEVQRATENQLAELADEITQGHKREEDYVKYIRELEQKNDDLERSQRAMYTSLGEFESKLNYALERNVLLESELDEKESLKTMVQRLKDEARDLKQEIQVREKCRHTTENDKLRLVDSNKMEMCEKEGSGDIALSCSQSPSALQPPLKNMNHTLTNGMTSPTRISATNIVNDLLRRVGVLETNIASCRTSPRDLQTNSYRDLSLSPGDGYYRLSKEIS